MVNVGPPIAIAAAVSGARPADPAGSLDSATVAAWMGVAVAVVGIVVTAVVAVAIARWQDRRSREQAKPAKSTAPAPCRPGGAARPERGLAA